MVGMFFVAICSILRVTQAARPGCCKNSEAEVVHGSKMCEAHASVTKAELQ
jgi:hypothetical protein